VTDCGGGMSAVCTADTAIH